MDLRGLDLPRRVVEHLHDQGVRSLFPPQAAAVEAGVLDGENVVVAVPTASGKTLIGQLAMLSAPGTALYIVPLRALAAEKHAAFSAVPGVEVGIATGDYEATGASLEEYDILVATSEKADSLLRAGGSWLAELGCVVVDEVHLVDDAARGPTLEMTVAKLMELRPSLQVVALSATVANPEAVAAWVDGAVVASDWRPVELRTGVYHDDAITFPLGRHDVAGSGDATKALIRDVLGANGQCLVFVHSRRAAEELAEEFADGWFGRSDTGVVTDVEEAVRTVTGERLIECVRAGVAFHHAGLRPAHRMRIEQAFRDRELDVVCATPTLAAGVNIPARRVIVRDHWRYTASGREPLSVLEAHQMFGRAGRPGLDPYGEAVLIAESADEVDALWERYVEGEPGPVASKLASQDALRTHVLSTIASGFADSRPELLGVLEGTFYAAQADHGVLVDIADLVLDYLADVAMVRRDAGLEATPLGERVSQLYIDPETGAGFIDAFDAMAALGAVTTVTVLEVVCDSPDMDTLYLRGRDRAAAYRFAERHEAEFVTSLAGFDGDFDAWLEAIKTVRVLAAWLEGASEAVITEEHGIGPGDLRMITERAEWLVGAAETLAVDADSPVAAEIQSVREGFTARAA